MRTEPPFVSPFGLHVSLPGPAETVLTSQYRALDRDSRAAADAQAWLYLMDRDKLRRALAVLEGSQAFSPLVAVLTVEDAIRWGELPRALGRLEALARQGGVGEPVVVAWARLREVEVLERLGRLAEARVKLQAARVLDAGVDTPTREMATLGAVVAARLQFRGGDPAAALATLEATPPQGERATPVLGAWLRGQAIYTSLSGRPDRALGQHKRALDCFRSLGDRYHLIKQYLSLGQTFLGEGELDHAELYVDKAADVLSTLPHPQLQGLVKSRGGVIALLRGDLERARACFAEDVALSEGAARSEGAALSEGASLSAGAAPAPALAPAVSYAKRNLGKVLVRLGHVGEGVALLEASHEGFRRYGDPVNARISRLEVIAARLPESIPGERAAHLEELEEMVRFFEARGRSALSTQVESVRAQLLVRQGRTSEARALVERVVGDLRRQRRGDRLVEFLIAVAATYPSQSREEARALLRLAYREAESSGRYWAARRVLKALDQESEVAVLDLARAPRIPSVSEEAAPPGVQGGFFAQSRSEPFRRLVQEARRVARADITVLVLGETGVGKDWLARYLHRLGPRAEQVYRAYNCGAVAESILEAELFGYEQGAFTGADQSRVGLFEAADGGTVFLDEVGELSTHAQAALLRVLDQKVVQPVGSTQPRAVDVRILAATNRDLAEAVAAGRFRADLYYRLAVYTLRIPSLRERGEDIPLLVQHFLERMSPAVRGRIRDVDPAALAALARYPWPGNLRELDNVLQGAAIRCGPRGRTLRLRHLPAHIAEPSALTGLARFPSLADMERDHIREALRQARGNQSEAAKLLGIHRNTLANKMRKYGLDG